MTLPGDFTSCILWIDDREKQGQLSHGPQRQQAGWAVCEVPSLGISKEAWEDSGRPTNEKGVVGIEAACPPGTEHGWVAWRKLRLTLKEQKPAWEALASSP